MVGEGGYSLIGRPVTSRPTFLAPRLPGMEGVGGAVCSAGVINRPEWLLPW